MEKSDIEKLRTLSKEEKMEIISLLWDDLVDQPDDVTVPPEHQQIINHRLSRLKAGEARLKSWSDIRKKYSSQ